MDQNWLQQMLLNGFSRADAYIKYGIQVYFLEEYQLAIESLSVTINLDPNFAKAYFFRGDAKFKLGDRAGAIADYDQVIRIDPENISAYYKRAIAKSDLGDWAGAIADYSEIIRINPKDVRAYEKRTTAKLVRILFKNAGLKSASGDWAGAIADYDQAIRICPDYFGAYFDRAVTKYQSGDREGAKADFEQAIRINPRDADAYSNLGGVKFELGDREGAMVDFDQAIRIDPRNVDAYYNRSIAQLDLGLLDDARKSVLKVIFLDKHVERRQMMFEGLPDNFFPPFLVCKLVREDYLLTDYNFKNPARQCHPVLAVLRYQELEQPLKGRDANWFAALMHLGLGDPIGAWRHLEALDDGDELALRYFQMATAEDFLHDDRTTLADRAVRAAREYAGDDARQWFYAGRILQFAGDEAAAAICYTHAPDYWPAAYAKAALSMEKVDTAENVREGPGVLTVRPDGRQWLDDLEYALQFYELEAEIAMLEGIVEPFPRFWEIWDISLLAGPLCRLEAEALLRECDRKPAAGEASDEMQIKAADLEQSLQSDDLARDLGLLIHANGWDHLNAFTEYGYLKEKIQAEEAIYLYFYAGAGLFPEFAVDMLSGIYEKWMERFFYLLHLSAPHEVKAAGALETLIEDYLRQAARRHRRDRLPVSDEERPTYEQFKTAFKNYVADNRALLGEDIFFQCYPIQGFSQLPG